MSVYKRASGRYAVSVDLQNGANTPRKRQNLGTYRTMAEAKKAERAALQARDQGIDFTPGKMTVGELFQRFMQDCEARKLSGTTLHGYRQIWKRCETITHIHVARLRPLHLHELNALLSLTGWTGGKGPLSTRSVRHTHELIGMVLAWAVRMQLVGRSVADAVQPPRGAKTKARPYTRQDALRLIEEATKTRYGPLVIFAFESGLRRGELAGLKSADIDRDRRIVTIRGSVGQVPGQTWYKSTKTDTVKPVALSNIAIEALNAQRVQQAKDKLAAGEFYDDQGFVFTPELGGLPSPGAISHAIRRVAARAGLSLRSVHGMRHSGGSWLLRAGVDAVTVCAFLRHSSPATTLNVYAHEIAGAQAEAVEHLLGDGYRMATVGGKTTGNP